MKLAIILLVIICLLFLFLLFGNRITINLFKQGTQNLSNTLLVNASPEDSSRIILLQDELVAAFKKGMLRQDKLKSLTAIVDTAMIDSIISNEERESILQFIESLVMKETTEVTEGRHFLFYSLCAQIFHKIFLI